jgi:benzoyl-CoA reductase/2-hydroxyglutaryl-CoA dehydratase subunit BcrC/BadD/HgdB
MLPVTVRGDEYGDFPGPWDVLDGWVFPPVTGLPPEREKFLDETVRSHPRISLRLSSARTKVPSIEETLDGIERFREWAGEISGRPVSDGSLSKSIAAFNEHRVLLSSLEERLSKFPGGYAALEVLWLVRSAMVLPREAHSLLLRSALSRDPAPGRAIRARLFLGGGMASRTVMEAIDAAGGTLVGQDLVEGCRIRAAMVDEEGDPALALARRLRALVSGAAESSTGRRGAAMLLERAEEAGADRFLYLGSGAIGPEEEERSLAEEAGRRGIPFLYLETDLSPRASEGQKERIASFIAAGG